MQNIFLHKSDITKFIKENILGLQTEFLTLKSTKSFQLNSKLSFWFCSKSIDYTST